MGSRLRTWPVRFWPYLHATWWRHVRAVHALAGSPYDRLPQPSRCPAPTDYLFAAAAGPTAHGGSGQGPGPEAHLRQQRQRECLPPHELLLRHAELTHEASHVRVRVAALQLFVAQCGLRSAGKVGARSAPEQQAWRGAGRGATCGKAHGHTAAWDITQPQRPLGRRTCSPSSRTTLL